jgi:geranylgeranyl diphosphate synthase type II
VNLDRYLASRRQLVDRHLAAYFPTDHAPTRRLAEAMRYSLLAGGKRIRPVLMMAAAEAVGGEARGVLSFACAIEMIHTYSLIHDDLPAMDDDALRRGKPTSHVVFGEGLAILAGDALLTEAFRIMAEATGVRVPLRRGLQVMREIARAAGAEGMVGGQAADLAAEGTSADLPTVELIHVRKTGAVLLAAVRAGAILGGASPGALRRLTRYGEYLGLAFQVADDILDAEGSVSGKVGGRDSVRRKVTYPGVIGLAAAKERARELRDLAIAELAGFSRRADPLRGVARLVVARAVAPAPVAPRRRAR